MVFWSTWQKSNIWSPPIPKTNIWLFSYCIYSPCCHWVKNTEESAAIPPDYRATSFPRLWDSSLLLSCSMQGFKLRFVLTTPVLLNENNEPFICTTLCVHLLFGVADSIQRVYWSFWTENSRLLQVEMVLMRTERLHQITTVPGCRSKTMSWKMLKGTRREPGDYFLLLNHC